MSSSARERRQRAGQLLARAGSLRPRKVKRAAAVAAEVEAELDELRALGYSELPDSRWLNPAGELVKGA